ncbi:hypothetical protein FNI11_13020 [Salmonella enterica subsp. salamae]|nr:hypothetical protein [Salmonella enterica subsp. salamae]ECJ2281276.1 hypothetical protein [Salmonella enterica subsp. salamae]HCC0890028.1 hypothetical protein [Salmonella enterica]
MKLVHDAETGAYEVSCRDLPLLHSVSDTVEDAFLEAEDGIIMAISLEMDMRRPIPVASAPQVDRLLDVKHSSKVELALAQLGRKAQVEIR